jgi:cystine transport system permease protein
MPGWFYYPHYVNFIFLGLLLGFIVALIRLYGPAPLKSVVRFYVWIIRGTPLLVQLFLIFTPCPASGSPLMPFRPRLSALP